MVFLKNKFFVLFTILVCLTIFILGCEKDKSVIFPSSLSGTWVTDDPRYQDKYIEINETTIVIGIGKNKSNTFFIDNIKKNKKISINEWIFTCQDIEGNSFEYSIFTNNESNKNLITLRNMRKIIWYKIEN